MDKMQTAIGFLKNNCQFPCYKYTFNYKQKASLFIFTKSTCKNPILVIKYFLTTFLGDDFLQYLWVALGVILFLIIAVIIISYICFRIAFFVPRRKSDNMTDIVPIPEGEIYDIHRDSIKKWVEETRAMPRQEFSIISFDGLKLHGVYYEYAPGAPTEIMFHGYRGSAERDLAGGVQRCFKLRRSALIVDQRCSGKSEGSVITFGINEYKDCLKWVEFMNEHFGTKQKLMLTGISMGAATVLMAGGTDLPENVIGILADCGYSSAKEIIMSVIKDMKLPPKLAYPFVKLGAKLFGHFDLEETSPIEAVKKCKVPVIFYHGEDDTFVPTDMSRKMYEACKVKKGLVTIPGAGHGLSYVIDGEKYLETLEEFFVPEGSYNE